jgi:hypothetical protein
MCAAHHPALFWQNRAKLCNALDYANKVGQPSAPFTRIICTMQNGTCFAGARPPESSLSVRLTEN